MTDDFYIALAEALHGIANDIGSLAGTGLYEDLHLSLTIIPRLVNTDEEKVHVVDTIATALLGKVGALQKMSGGSYHYDAKGTRGGVQIAVFDSVSGPEDKAKDAEIARLRAENERLRNRPPFREDPEGLPVALPSPDMPGPDEGGASC